MSHEPIRLGRRRFIQAAGLTTLSGTGLLASTAVAVSAVEHGSTGCVATRDLGPGAVDFPIIGGALVGGKALAGSRNLTPAKVAVFDVATSSVTAEVVIPVGTNLFVQAIAPAGDHEAYIGTLGARNSTNLYHYDIATDTLTGVAALDMHMRGVTVAPDGMVFAVGEPSRVYAYTLPAEPSASSRRPTRPPRRATAWSPPTRRCSWARATSPRATALHA